MHIQLFVASFYLLYLFLNSCDGNDAFWRHSVLVKQSSFFSRKHQILSLQIWCRNVCTLYKTHDCNTSDLL